MNASPESLVQGSAFARPHLPPGLQDVLRAFALPHQWLFLGWHAFRSRSRRARLGVVWEPLQALIWVLALTQIFRAVLSHTNENYIAYVAAGIVFWNYVMGSISGGASAYARSRRYILNINNPMFLYPLQHITALISRLLFQFPVYLVVLPVANVPFGRETLYFIPGLALFLLTSVWVVPLLGMVGARYRDTPFALQSLMRFLFFATPVFWMAEGLGQRAYLATFNPLTHFLAVVREPLLGKAPPPISWVVVGAISVSGLVVTLFLYNRLHRRIVFWL